MEIAGAILSKKNNKYEYTFNNIFSLIEICENSKNDFNENYQIELIFSTNNQHYFIKDFQNEYNSKDVIFDLKKIVKNIKSIYKIKNFDINKFDEIIDSWLKEILKKQII